MKLSFFIKKLFSNLFWGAVMIGGVYLFLSLCNWDLSLGGWNGFSRFLGGIIGAFLGYFTLQAIIADAKKLRTKKS
jgi:hypothetical protein